MKPKSLKQVSVEEMIRLLDNGLEARDVSGKFSDAERKEVDLHLRVLDDVKGAGERVRPRAELLKDALAKISLPETPAVEIAPSRISFVLERFPRKLVFSGSVIVVLVLVFAAIGERDAVVPLEDSQGGEFMALMEALPETPPSTTLRKEDASVGTTANTSSDLFDEESIAREGAKADEDFAAAEEFFARDEEVDKALAEF